MTVSTIKKVFPYPIQQVWNLMTSLDTYASVSYTHLEFTEEEIIALTKDGVELGCATICINPGYMDLCEPIVKGSDTMLCPVCDFPFGTSSTESKLKQIEIVARYDTVKEIDVVANFGHIRSGKYDAVTADLKACAELAHSYGRALKVIFETDALNEEQVRNCLLYTSKGTSANLLCVPAPIFTPSISPRLIWL